MKEYQKPEVEVVKFTTMEAIAGFPGGELGDTSGGDGDWEDEED